MGHAQQGEAAGEPPSVDEALVEIEVGHDLGAAPAGGYRAKRAGASPSGRVGDRMDWEGSVLTTIACISPAVLILKERPEREGGRGGGWNGA